MAVVVANTLHISPFAKDVLRRSSLNRDDFGVPKIPLRGSGPIQIDLKNCASPAQISPTADTHRQPPQRQQRDRPLSHSRLNTPEAQLRSPSRKLSELGRGRSRGVVHAYRRPKAAVNELRADGL